MPIDPFLRALPKGSPLHEAHSHWASGALGRTSRRDRRGYSPAESSPATEEEQ
jgi:hypothetical protein